MKYCGSCDGYPVAASFFTIRSPLLPFEVFEEWGKDLQAPLAFATGSQDLENAIETDRECLRERLRSWISEPRVREALFIASSDFENGIRVWEETPDSKRGLRAEKALFRYFTRMVGRTTPFGLFAGYSVGRIGDETNFEFAPATRHRRHTRLDAEYVVGLARRLACDAKLQLTATLRPNPTIYFIDGRVRYVQERVAENGEHESILAAGEDSRELRCVLERAALGARQSELLEALAGCGISADEARGFIAALLEARVLISDVEPTVTGPEPLTQLLNALSREPAHQQTHALLAEAATMIRRLDSGEANTPVEAYRAIGRSLEPLSGPIDLSRLIQVDLIKAAPDATLGAAVIDELLCGVELLRRMFPIEDFDLRDFRQRFTERYQQQEVPLLIALDEDYGIGPLREAEEPPLRTSDFAVDFRDREAALVELISRAVANGTSEVELTDDIIARLQLREPPALPHAFGIQAMLESSPNEQSPDAFRVVLLWCMGPSGVATLGRFCHGDEELSDLVQSHLECEEQMSPRSLYAEVAHLSAPRFGNITCRPLLRSYEIASSGLSGAPAQQRIALSDLLLSVNDNRLVLRTRSSDREILPRLTSAQNARHILNVPVYRFLAALQRQSVQHALAWDWGNLGKCRYLPRIVWRRIVLSRQRWTLNTTELSSLDESTSVGRFYQAQELRRSLGLPRIVLFWEGDRQLAVDLNSSLSIDSFIDLARTQERAVLVEMYPNTGELAAHGPDGHYFHDFLVPVVRTDHLGMPHSQSRPSCRPHDPTQRRFVPGSEWLFAKFYSGAGIADHILRDLIAPFVESAVDEGWLDRWFFLRYVDPEHHIRLRLHGEPAVLWGQLLPALHRHCATALNSGMLWKLQCDTYEREVERYGGNRGVEIAEKIAHHDSQAVLALLSLLKDSDSPSTERLAFRSVDDFLNAWLPDCPSKLEFVTTSLPQSNKADRVFWDREFRNRRSLIEAAFRNTAVDREWKRASEILRKRFEAISPLMLSVKELDETGGLSRPFSELAGSYLHMHMNRLLSSPNGEAEVKFLELLRRYYRGVLARNGYR